MGKLRSLGSGLGVAVIGSSGGIGRALVARLSADPAVARIFAASRSPHTTASPKVSRLELDLSDEMSIKVAADTCARYGPLDIVIVASGILHDSPDYMPEKSWSQLNATAMERVFAINCTGPALVAKHYLPLLNARRRSVFAALSARVGSIGDNGLGGWYAYRASKAALNMIIRSLAIELARTKPKAICVGLHPGTVDTDLSAPFRSGVPAAQLFSPSRAADHLLTVIAEATPRQSGRVLAWDGTEIEP